MTDSHCTTSDNEQDTGLPAPRTWRGVYICVTVIFVVIVLLLTALSRVYS
jgi:hypothetical protein